MAHGVSRHNVTAEAQFSPRGTLVDKVFPRLLRFYLAISFPPELHEMNTGPVGGCRSETWSHPIDAKDKNLKSAQPVSRPKFELGTFKIVKR
jgi:hypothetical protein